MTTINGNFISNDRQFHSFKEKFEGNEHKKKASNQVN